MSFLYLRFYNYSDLIRGLKKKTNLQRNRGGYYEAD